MLGALAFDLERRLPAPDDALEEIAPLHLERQSAREAARHCLWDSQREGLAAVRSQVLRGGPRARALEIAVPDSTR